MSAPSSPTWPTNPTWPGGAGGGIDVSQMAFPRLAINIAWYDTRQNATMRRYQLVCGTYDRDPGIADSNGVTLSPQSIYLAYIGPMSPSWNDQVRDAQYEKADFSPLWWLRSIGSTLAADVPNAATTGTAVAGTLSTITLGAGANSLVDVYSGKKLRIIAGVGAGQTVTIPPGGYNPSTRVVAPTGGFTTAPSGTGGNPSVYSIADNPADTDNLITVLDASRYVVNGIILVGRELMTVRNIAGTTLTVDRGQNSTPSAHLLANAIPGAPRLADVVWPLTGGAVDSYGNKYGDMTAFCPKDAGLDFTYPTRQPYTDWTFADWFYAYITAVLDGTVLKWAGQYSGKAPSYAGIFIDNAGPRMWVLDQGNVIDANVDGVPDSGYGWVQQIDKMLSQFQLDHPDQVVQVNAGQYTGAASSQFFEAAFFLDGVYAFVNNMQVDASVAGRDQQFAGFFCDFPQYQARAAHGSKLALSTMDAQLGTGHVPRLSDTVDDFTYLRFAFGVTCLGDGFFCVDEAALRYGFVSGGTHGQTWMLDEMDGGQGSCLAAAVPGFPTTTGIASGTTAQTITLVTGGGRSFTVGDVIRIPGDLVSVNASMLDDSHGTRNPDEEHLLITGAAGDTLTVTRGYHGTVPQAHSVLQKVLTDAQIAQGTGWMGRALGPYSLLLAASGTELISNGGMENWSGTAGLLNWNSFHYRSYAGITKDTVNFHSGAASLRAQITNIVDRVFNPNPYIFSLSVLTINQSISLVSGRVYTLSFWARATVAMWPLQTQIRSADGTQIRNSQQFIVVDNVWRYYACTFVAQATESATLDFGLGGQVGGLGIDDISCQQVDNQLFRRDFEHATVIVNATRGPQTVNLAGDGHTYARISGGQVPLVNTGAPVTTVTIPSLDAAILHRT